MSRGALTEAEWRLLKDLLPTEREARVVRRSTIGCLSTASYGASEPAHPARKVWQVEDDLSALAALERGRSLCYDQLARSFRVTRYIAAMRKCLRTATL